MSRSAGCAGRPRPAGRSPAASTPRISALPSGGPTAGARPSSDHRPDEHDRCEHSGCGPDQLDRRASRGEGSRSAIEPSEGSAPPAGREHRRHGRTPAAQRPGHAAMAREHRRALRSRWSRSATSSCSRSSGRSSSASARTSPAAPRSGGAPRARDVIASFSPRVRIGAWNRSCHSISDEALDAFAAASIPLAFQPVASAGDVVGHLPGASSSVAIRSRARYRRLMIVASFSPSARAACR